MSGTLQIKIMSRIGTGLYEGEGPAGSKLHTAELCPRPAVLHSPKVKEQPGQK